MEVEYLTTNHLVGFDKYKYSCKDTGPLSIYVMHPFWNWLVQFCPKWVAPNLMTFSGFLFAVLTFMLFAWKDYGFYASDPDHPEFPALPRWTFTVAALFLFLAYTLGKQKYVTRCKTDVRLFRWYRWETGETDGEQWTFRGVVRPRSRFFHGRFNSGRSVFTLRTWSQIQYHSIPYVLHIVERFVQFLFIPLGKVQYRCLILALGVRLFNVGHHSSLFTCRG
jgi:hypothetical protein